MTKENKENKKPKNNLSVEAIVKKIEELEKNAPPVPILRRYKTNDATIEKLGEMLRDNPRGFFVHRDELVGVLVSWERAGHEGDRTFFLESWNGSDSFDTDRIGRGEISIPNLCLSVFGGIQPDKLRALLEEMSDALANDGTLQRFQVLVFPDFHTWEYRDRTPNKEARKKVYEMFEKLASVDPVTLGAFQADESNKFPYFNFSLEAQDIFIGFSTELHTQKILAEDNPLIAQHLTKYEKLFPALALILHIVDCLLTGNNGPVSKQAALWAAAWCQYLESHARRCYGLLADAGLCSAQHLSEKIKKGKLKDGFTAREVHRAQWSTLKTPEAVQIALDWLVDAHWLRSTPVPAGPSGGRPTCTYQINPKIPRQEPVDGDKLD